MPGPNQAFKAGAVKPKNLKKTILRLVGYLTRSRLPLLFVLLCLLTSVATNLGGSYMVRPIANLLIDPNRTLQEKLSGLAVLIALLAGIYLLGCLATYGQSATMVRLAERGVNRLRRDLFDSLQSLPLSYFDQHPHGELMSRFTNDADNVELALQQSVVSLLSSCLMFVGLVGLMLFINWKLFFVTAVVLVLTMTLFRKLGGRSRQFYQKQQKALGAVNGEIQEVIEGLKVVKAFTHEEEAKAKFRELNNAYRDSAQKANFYSTMIMPMAGNLMNISYALTAAFGGLLSVLQGFDLGGLATYLNYSRQVGQPLNQISQQMTTLLSAMAGAERIFEVMDTAAELDEGSVTLIPAEKDANGTLSPFTGQGRPRTWAWKTPRSNGMELVPVFVGEDETLTEIIDPEAVPDPAMLANHGWAWKYPGPDGVVGLHLIRGTVRNVPGEDFYLTELRGAVRFSHVDFSYVPGKRILKDVSVYADPGQKIAFVGSTGAGKTTITNLINRFYEIEGGMITYDGIRVKAIRKDDLRRSLGAVLQDTHLFTGTIMDNIRYGRLDATDEECIAAAKSANAHSFIRRLPEGYQTMVTGDGANLSQGQRQLLAIARAAVADPPVMILDEATSSIDTRTEALIQQGMDTLMEGRTVFVIAHRLSTVRNSNCIVVIEHGEIEEKGSHEELLKDKGRYYRLYTGQFQLS
ncbi:ABC transporter ATP-binding protein [Lawsonibacter sp. JLR.KK007]|jgi:ATP-binding cassette subfamily B protein|uniref:ABC transporter ATP-binding protein n=1 Tax=Lawsonibacter sp. JLR.KK007 TaxID=3114293 RepID=UPI002FF3611C